MFSRRHTARSPRGRFRFTKLLTIAMLACALLSGVATAGASAATPEGMFGINPGDVFKLPQAQWDAHLAAMKADGIETVRMGAWWSDLENAPPVNGVHTYSWSELDQRVVALAQHGLRWAPLLSFSPTWGSKVAGDYSAAPASNANFAAFAAALAARYGRGGSFWAEHPELTALPVTSYELWNEENSSVYWHPGDAASYADLYAAGRDAIHTVDDAATVEVGGLAATANGATPADDFVRQMLAHRPDLRGHIDAVAFHPYAADVAGVYAAVASFRHALDSIAGPGIPLDLTEIGWSTTTTPEAERAADLSTLATTLTRSDCGIESVVPYAWLGPEQDRTDREQWFGIENADATPKPSAVAYAAAAQLMRGLSATPAPTSTVAICSAAARAAGPAAAGAAAVPAAAAKARHAFRVHVALHQDRRHRTRLRVAARCPVGCRLRFVLVRPSGATAASYSSHVSRHFTRRRSVTLHIPRRLVGHRVRVKVTAIARNGRQAHRSKTLRLH